MDPKRSLEVALIRSGLSNCSTITTPNTSWLRTAEPEQPERPSNASHRVNIDGGRP